METRVTLGDGREIEFDDRHVVDPSGYLCAIDSEGKYDPHSRMRGFAMGNEYGLLAIVFADNASDAIDAAADADKLICMKVSEDELGDYGETEEEQYERLHHLGNAGEPYDTESLWYEEFALPPFSFAAIVAGQRAEISEAVTKRYEEERYCLARDLDFLRGMVRSAQKAFEAGEVERGHACLAHGLDFRFSTTVPKVEPLTQASNDSAVQPRP